MTSKHDELFNYSKEPVGAIDLSLNCPAIVIIPPTSKPSFILPFQDTKAYYLTHIQKYAIEEGNIQGELFGSWENESERYETIAEWCVGVLQENKVNHVAIEDLAYSKHRSLSQLAENAGLLKYFLYKHDITYDLYSPSSIKKSATNKGNAKKEQMRDAFYQDTDFDIQGIYGRKPTDKPSSPVNDIIDAYYLALSARVANAAQEQHYSKGRKDEDKQGNAR